MGLLDGKNAIVTGSNRGIGRAIVDTFAHNGANVWACARKETSEFVQDMADLAERCEVKVRPVFFDMADVNSMSKAVRTIRSTQETIDILVNNAGIISENASFLMTSSDSLERVFEVNFFSQIRFTQYIVRLMIASSEGASIVNLSSIAARAGMPGQLGYACSKAAMETATVMLARELSQNAIRVNAVAPGFIRTDMGLGASGDVIEDVLSSSAMGRMGQACEIADAVLFLASDLSSYMTGQVLHVDGGGCFLNG